MFKTKNQAPDSARCAGFTSPFGGSYVAAFDRPQAVPGTSGGSYTGALSREAQGYGVDNYVARFDAPAFSAGGRRGSYVDVES
ncbi:hypothetical protein LOC59_06870 [Arthrobacter sp. zg-Y916]|uniref:Uncharacterized protein n=1 Tax=Arthrobacter caoxuetaonis TaxID=2886935 RepID=A0A9X1MHC5_9MICC|nr:MULTISPECIES: hypothetical protein [Arthrobacter]MCC3298927.1 hypothetical protein [Arthrobacter caoxuetaonis]MCC9193368.1 hypothetical protein [Arthrobacter sp. zg-Y916]USQ58727.1 hypothetical protein NF551_07950 [Arthrobacter caoxuetaonis]